MTPTNERSRLTVSPLWTLYPPPDPIVVRFSLFGPLESHNPALPFRNLHIFPVFRPIFFGGSMVVIYLSIRPSASPVLSCSPNSHRNFVSPTHLHADKHSRAPFSYTHQLSSPSFVMHVCTVKQIFPLFFSLSPFFPFQLPRSFALIFFSI